jgi:uncharacterized membrane protein
MALGIGALIPRNGFGLYALLEASGERGWWAMLMLTIGCWMIAASYLRRMPYLRIGMLSAGTAFWIVLSVKFVTASLWGAAIQGAVIVMFALDTICRLYVQAKKKHSTSYQETDDE